MTHTRPIPRAMAGSPGRTFAILYPLLSILTFSPQLPAADHPHPTTSPTAIPSLDLYPTPTRLHLLTATGTPARLFYQFSNDAGESWSPPIPVGTDQPPPHPIRRGQDAQLAASPDGKHLLAAWTTRGSADRFGRGPIATAYSHDAGQTWHPGPNPSDNPATSAGHAFLDLASTPDGAFHLVWLDARDGADAGKGLRYARTDDAGKTWSKNQTLDPQTCECCWNTIKSSPEGRLAVLYRNINCRDMSLLTSPDAGRTWSSTPSSVGTFQWDVNLCPHVGGGVAFSTNSTLLATVWTGSLDHIGAYTLASNDAGQTWSAPTRLPFRPRHTDIATDPSNPARAAIVFDTPTDTGPAIFSITTTDAGATWSAPKRLSREGTTPTHPRIVSTPQGFRAFWTDATTWTTAMIPN